MTNWTKGPWQFDYSEEGTLIVAKHERGVQTELTAVCALDFVDEAGNTMLFDNYEANARLIAAAPELREALDGLFEHCAMIHKHWGESSNQREAADAAIEFAKAALRKAKGE